MVRAKRKRRKKIRKEDSIRLRVTTEQKKLLTDAATKAGVGLSAWMLMTTLKAAWEILKA